MFFLFSFAHAESGILVTDQGSKLCFLQWKQSLNYWTAREAHRIRKQHSESPEGVLNPYHFYYAQFETQ